MSFSSCAQPSTALVLKEFYFVLGYIMNCLTENGWNYLFFYFFSLQNHWNALVRYGV